MTVTFIEMNKLTKRYIRQNKRSNLVYMKGTRGKEIIFNNKRENTGIDGKKGVGNVYWDSKSSYHEVLESKNFVAIYRSRKRGGNLCSKLYVPGGTN